jgi:hypothetical protein
MQYHGSLSKRPSVESVSPTVFFTSFWKCPAHATLMSGVTSSGTTFVRETSAPAFEKFPWDQTRLVLHQKLLQKYSRRIHWFSPNERRYSLNQIFAIGAGDKDRANLFLTSSQVRNLHNKISFNKGSPPWRRRIVQKEETTNNEVS